MLPTRRTLLGAGLATLTGLAARPSTATAPSGRLGLVIHSFPIRAAAERGADGEPGFADPLRFLELSHTLGSHAIQVGIGVRDAAYADRLRARAEALAMGVEGIALLPRDQADQDRFEAEIQTASRAGANIVRTVTLTGRRYETFDSLSAFRKFADHAEHSLALAAPVVVRHGVRLAVENHKDWRADQLLALIKKIGCDQLGVCLDTGNSVALLEEPHEVIEALAPLAFTTHFKDIGVEEYREGFLLSEVPLGTGILDLPRVVQTLKKAQPGIRFNIEMITRDPLAIPCLTDRYWATFPDLPGQTLARSLSMVKSHPPRTPLPRPSRLARERQLHVEDENVRLCLSFAHERLAL